jgi:hypothetical protein
MKNIIIKENFARSVYIGDDLVKIIIFEVARDEKMENPVLEIEIGLK